MNQIFEQAEARMNEIKRGRDSKVAATQKKLTEARAAVTQAEAAIEKAAEKEDVKAYQKAKTERADALSAVELFERRLSTLKNEPLITEEEYKKTSSELMRAIAAEDEEAFAKLEQLAQQMQEIGDDLQGVINLGNRLLARWQHDIFKEPRDVHHRTRQYTKGSTTWWAGLAAVRKPE